GGARRAAPALLRRDDPGCRPAPHLRGARREPRYADRLGAVEARLRGGARLRRTALRACTRRRVVPDPGRPSGRGDRRGGERRGGAGRGGAADAVLRAAVDAACARLAPARPRAGSRAAAAPRPPAVVLGARPLRTLLLSLLRGARRRPARAPRGRRVLG